MRKVSNMTDRVQDKQKKRIEREGTDNEGHVENFKTINPIITILRDT